MPYPNNKNWATERIDQNGQIKDRFYNCYLDDDDFATIDAWDKDTFCWWIEAIDIHTTTKRMDVKYNEKLQLMQCNITYTLTENGMNFKGIMIAYGTTAQAAMKTAAYFASTKTQDEMFQEKQSVKRRVL